MLPPRHATAAKLQSIDRIACQGWKGSEPVTEINKDENQLVFSLMHVCFSMATADELVEPTGRRPQGSVVFLVSQV
jgi:hypothetical protein